MTAEGPTGAPLRQQIAEAIHAKMHGRDCIADICVEELLNDRGDCFAAADAVVALLNLTEERQQVVGRSTTGRPGLMFQRGKFRTRLVTPWLPTTPPDTSSSETT